MPADTFALQGSWNVTGQDVESAAPGAAIVLRYTAAEVNLVAGAGATGGPTMLAVTLDGVAQPPVSVSGDDLYRVIENGPAGQHTLVLTPATNGFQAYSFTFGSGTG
jgi:hypothetical protein